MPQHFAEPHTYLDYPGGENVGFRIQHLPGYKPSPRRVERPCSPTVSWHERTDAETFQHYILTQFNVGLYEHRGRDVSGRSICADPHKWMEERLYLFETICAPSMRNQTCQNFKWIICCDEQTPDSALQRIMDAHSNIEIFSVRSSAVPRVNNRHVWILACSRIALGLAGEQQLITTRLDNDDALRRDFVETVQRCVPDAPRATICFPNVVIHHLLLRTSAFLTFYWNSYLSMVESAARGFHTVWETQYHVMLGKRYPIVNIIREPMLMIAAHGRNLINGEGWEKNSDKVFDDWEAFGIDPAVANNWGESGLRRNVL